MSIDERVLFLVDADNVSLDIIERALALKQKEHGAVHVRRCYCSAEFAQKNLAFFKEHSMRAMVNATAGKNCTDIALAVDAVQLCATSVPLVVVIVASDSDFAPLVVHLRELGCRVEGVGQEGKTGAESPRAYDAFVDLPVARKRTTRAAPVKSRDVDEDEPALAPAPARRAAAAPASAPTTRRAAELPDDVARWLDALPELASGRKVELNVAAEALRREGLLSKSGASTKLFRKYPDSFELAAGKQPNWVRYRG